MKTLRDRGVREAHTIAAELCEGCGQPVVRLRHASGRIFAQAHLPAPYKDWLEEEFIPTLRGLDERRSA